MFNRNNVHRSYKKVIGTSVACLSILATIAVGASDSHAANNLKPEIVKAMEYVAPQTALADKIAEEAVKHVGVPYVTGGTSTKGFDCSGFTQHVFKAAEVALPRVSRSQAVIDTSSAFNEKTTTITNKNDIQKGDLIFFSGTPGRVSHVGIALDNNKYIHASTSKRSITIANRSGSWYNGKFTKAIRVAQ